MKATVTDQCDGAGECVKTCPQVFEMGDDGHAKVKVETVPDEAQGACREAKDMCPFQAIEVQE